jgi:MFS family permease
VSTGVVLEQRRRVRGAAAFWILAVLFLMLFVASAAASPLYLFFGSVSDYLGRLPMIITALVFSVAGCVVFLAAHGAGELYLARSLQGVATGLASGPTGAALIDLQPAGSQRAPLVTSTFSNLGLAVGALVTSVLWCTRLRSPSWSWPRPGSCWCAGPQ